MLSASSPVTFNDALPESVDVVIIGAGVIGISTAWFLNRSGYSVLVCEKGRVAGEQSSRNWGWIRQQSRDPAELPIMIDSLNTWAGLEKETGENLGFTRHGVMYLADNEKQLAQFEEWLDVAQQHQVDTRMLSRAEVDQLVTDRPGQWLGAMFTPSDGRAEPFIAIPRFARAANAAGVHIRENCAVRSLDVQAGRINGVITEHGRVKASSVLCAAGAWSSLFAGNHDITIPQLTVRATVARTNPAPNIYDGNAAGSGIAFRRRADGGYTLASGGSNEHFVGADSFRYFRQFLPALRTSRKFLRLRFGGELISRLTPTTSWQPDTVTPFEKNRVLNPAPSKKAVAEIEARLKVLLPSLADAGIAESWAGMIDVTPDVVPVMDEAAAIPGLFVATGFSGHGFGFGPGAGKVMANMIEGKSPSHDLTRFRLSRFSDGSPMIPGPGL